MKLEGFVGQSYTTENPQFDCTETVNLYIDIDEARTGKGGNVSQFLSTPGLVHAMQVAIGDGSKPIRALYTASNGFAFAVCSNTLYRITGRNPPFNTIEIGNLSSNRGVVSLADSGDLLVLVDGNFGYSYDMTGAGGFSQITDPNFLGATHVAYYDTYFVFNQPGTNVFYWSDPNSVIFDASNFDSKSGAGDDIVALFVVNRELWLVGRQHTEVWYNQGGTDQTGAPVTFSRIPGPYNETGSQQPYSWATLDIGAIGVTSNTRGGQEVSITNGYQYQKISTYAVDRVLQASVGQITAYCYQQNGHLFYVLNPLNGKSSWCYDHTVSHQLGVPTWHERAYTNPSTQELSRHVGDNHCFYSGKHLIGDYRHSAIYYYDTEEGTDNDDPITRIRTSPVVSQELQRVTHNLFQLDCQVGVGPNQAEYPPVPPTPPYPLDLFSWNETEGVPPFVVYGNYTVGGVSPPAVGKISFDITVPPESLDVPNPLTVFSIVFQWDGASAYGPDIQVLDSDNLPINVGIIGTNPIEYSNLYKLTIGVKSTSPSFTINIPLDSPGTGSLVEATAEVFRFGNVRTMFYKNSGTGFTDSGPISTIMLGIQPPTYTHNVLFFNTISMDDYNPANTISATPSPGPTNGIPYPYTYTSPTPVFTAGTSSTVWTQTQFYIGTGVGFDAIFYMEYITQNEPPGGGLAYGVIQTSMAASSILDP